MKHIPTIVSFLFFVFFTSMVVPQRIPDTIAVAIENGNSQMLVSHFNSKIELVIVDNQSSYEDICSRAQAEMILGNFFSRHEPLQFSLMHEGERGELLYATGKLKTKDGEFHVTFLLKSVGSQDFIHQFRIEPNK